MQSSTTAACRVVVILICLIAIPVAALFGTRLPGLVCELARWEQDTASASSESLRSEAPPFRDSAAATSPGEVPSAPAWGSSGTGSALPTLLGDDSPRVTDSPRRSPAPASTHYHRGPSAGSSPQLLPGAAGPNGASRAAISPAVFESDRLPRVHVAPADWRRQSLGSEVRLASAGERAAGAQPFVATPQSKEMLRQLRQLGAQLNQRHKV